MRDIPDTEILAAIRDEALEWHLHLTSGAASDADRAAFMAWRESDPRCAAAYKRYGSLQADLRADPAIAAMAVPGEGIAAHAPRNVAGDDAPAADDHAAPLDALRGGHGARLRARFARPFFGAAAAAAAAVLLFSVWTAQAPVPGPLAPSAYETAASGIRELRLEDGSVVTLGAGSRVEVAFGKGSRLLRLTRGEANFQVAKDKARPFVVVAGNTSVRAVGTRFNVRLSARDVKVDVSEGVVEVFKPAPKSSGLAVDAGAPAVRLRAGEQTVALVATGSIAPPSPSSAALAVPPMLSPVELPAVPERRRYVGIPLSQLVAEANASRRVKIELASPEVGAMKVTTSFRPGEIDAVIDNLPAILPVEVERTPGGGAVISARE